MLQQVDAPQKLFDEPDNLFVAAFIGSPSMTLMEGTVAQENGGYVVKLGSQSLGIDSATINKRPALQGYLGRNITIGLRPKDFEDASIEPGHPRNQRLNVTIEKVEALGFERIVYFNLDANQVFSEDALDLEDGVELPPSKERTQVTGRFAPTSPARTGDDIEITVHVDDATSSTPRPAWQFAADLAKITNRFVNATDRIEVVPDSQPSVLVRCL